MQMRSRLYGMIFFWVLLFNGVVGAEEAGQLAGAKAEGRVVWYSGSNLRMAQAVSKAFEKKYPFVTVDLIRSSDERMLNRITTEKQAGKALFDVVNSQILPMMYRLNVIVPYAPPGARELEGKYKDPDGYWAGLHINHFVLAYNTRLVAKEEVPKDWGDLLDPRWKGRIGMDPEEFDWLGAMMDYLGEENARKLMSGLARQEIRWHKGHTQVTQLMAAGEFAAALSFGHRVEAMKKSGAPIEWVRTTRPIVVSVSKVALSATPPHPNAARLLVDFLISKEGQTEVYKNGNTPAYPGVLPKDSPLSSARLEVHPISPKITLELNRYVVEFDRFFGPRR